MSEAFRICLLHLDNNRSCSGPCTERCTVQNASSVFEQRAHRSPRKQPMYMTLKPRSLKSEVGIRVGLPSDSDEGDRAVEGSEEHFDESAPVDDGLAEEKRSAGGEDGSGQESDFAAEEGHEEGDSNAEEGHEEVWGEVHEALSTMGREDYDETALCKVSSVAILFIIIIPGVSAVLGCACTCGYIP
jgi:hypothetical protein